MAYTGPQILFTGQPAGGDFQASIIIGPSAGNEVTPITGSDNVGIGQNALASLTSGAANIAIGTNALPSLVTGEGNIGIGFSAGAFYNGSELFNIVIGDAEGIPGEQAVTRINVSPGGFIPAGTIIVDPTNTVMGYGVWSAIGYGASASTSLYNTMIGMASGSGYTDGTESSNIVINSAGGTGENNTLRIGSGTGTGNQQLQSTFISGINGVTVGSVASVVTINGDQLGSATITGGSGITITPTDNVITISSGGGGGGITTINGNSGTASGSTVTLTTGSADANGTALFTGDNSSTVTLTFDDVNNNLFLGFSSFNSTANGIRNVGLGEFAGSSLAADGSDFASENVFIGCFAGGNVTTGSGNVAVGYSASSNAESSNTVVIGNDAGSGTGNNNIAIGQSSNGGATGVNNVCIGSQAGLHYTAGESNNILVSNEGVSTENNTLRIGAGTGTGDQELQSTFIAGIDGVDVGSVASVVSISGDQLGTATITAGSGITVTPGANTITIAASGGGGITTIDGNSGSVTGSTVTITTGASNTNGTALFSGSGTTMTMKFDDSNANLFLGTTTFNATASGVDNVGLGTQAGKALTSGSANTLIGCAAGENITLGNDNTCVGIEAGSSTTTGSNNIAIGIAAEVSTTGQYNTSIGRQSGNSTNTGSYNLLHGYMAGSNYSGSESSNITFNAFGTASESNVLRIGQATGTSDQNINKAIICGIQTIVVTGTPVLVSTTNQLGVAASSMRFKKDIRDMGTASDVLYKLRPVSFMWNKESAAGLKNASLCRQYGLIAEEAINYVPNAVNLDKEGKPFNINYQDLVGMLINEVQRLSHRIEALEKKGE